MDARVQLYHKSTSTMVCPVAALARFMHMWTYRPDHSFIIFADMAAQTSMLWPQVT